MSVYLLRFDHLTERWRNSDACIVRAAPTSGRRFRLVRVWWERRCPIAEGRPFERKLKKAEHGACPERSRRVRHDPEPPPRSLPRTRSEVPLTLREEPARYSVGALPEHTGDGAEGRPPVLSRSRSWAACPFCGGSGRVRYSEPHPVTGVRIGGEEPPALSEAEVCEMCDGVGYPPHFAEPRVVYGVPFPLGRVLATPGALALAEEHSLDLPALVTRHQKGDWGTLCDDDRAANSLS